MRLIVIGVLAVSMTGCRHTPPPPPAVQPSAERSEPVGEPTANPDAQIAPAPQPATQPSDDPCPEGSKLVGEPPPMGYSQICVKAEGTDFSAGRNNRHGKATTWWRKNGQKKSEEHYKHGKRHGKVTRWLNNGQKTSEGNYTDGKKHGEWTSWHNNGQMLSQQKYKDGKLHGPYTPDGTPTATSNQRASSGKACRRANGANGAAMEG